MGVSGRFTYAYSDLFHGVQFGYLMLLNALMIRNTDGDFFPSVGGGWMISNEPFFQPRSVQNYEIETKSLIWFGGK